MKVKDLREAIRDLDDDEPVELSVSDPQDGVTYVLDGVMSAGEGVVINITAVDEYGYLEDDEEEDDE